MLEHQISTLSNGLRVVTVPMKGAQSATVMVGVGGGSRYEDRRTNGLFHFLEHMAFKGTKKRPTTLDIAAEIEGVGGVFNAFTSKEFTGYWIKLSVKHLELAFDILGDMLGNSLLKKEEIEREKGVIIEEINMYKDNYPVVAAEGIERLVYGDNPMGWSIVGEKETVSRLRRSDFLHALDKYYFAPNMVLAVAGGVNREAVLKLAKQYFGGLSRKGTNRLKKIKLLQKAAQVKLTTKKTEQAHFWLAVPAYDMFHPDRFAAMVLAAILGGGMSSRLFLKIRERHSLAYYVSAMAENCLDSGLFGVRAGVKLDKIEAAVKMVMEELSLVLKRKIGREEIERNKEMLKGNLILDLEDSHSVAERAAGQLVLEGKTRPVAETLRKIDAVTAADMQRVAKDLFRQQKLNFSLVGPFKDGSKFKRLLCLD